MPDHERFSGGVVSVVSGAGFTAMAELDAKTGCVASTDKV
jgi:hypothetical protein